MMNHRRLLRWGAAVSLLLLALDACRGSRSGWLPAGYIYAPMQWPVGWMGSGDALLVLHLERGVGAHGGMTECSRSGWYESTSADTATELLNRFDRDVCTLDLRPETVTKVGVSAELLVADTGGLLRVDPRTGELSRISITGVKAGPYAGWSASGQRLAVVGTPSDSASTAKGDRLYLAGLDGTDVHEVASFGEERPQSPPSWSPDMQRVVLSTASRSGGPLRSDGRLVVVDTTTGDKRVLASGYFPSWSPDGEWIGYISLPTLDTLSAARAQAQAARPAVRVVRPDGSQDHEVFGVSLMEGSPERHRRSGWPWAPVLWSPNGKLLAFSRLQDSGLAAWVVGLGGEGLNARAFRHQR